MLAAKGKRKITSARCLLMLIMMVIVLCLADSFVGYILSLECVASLDNEN
jgi:hypothetical protein